MVLTSILCLLSTCLGAGRENLDTVHEVYIDSFTPHCWHKKKAFLVSFHKEVTKYQKIIPSILAIKWRFKYMIITLQILCLLKDPCHKFSSSHMSFLLRASLPSSIRTVTSPKDLGLSTSSKSGNLSLPTIPNLPPPSFLSTINQYLFPEVFHSAWSTRNQQQLKIQSFLWEGVLNIFQNFKLGPEF